MFIQKLGTRLVANNLLLSINPKFSCQSTQRQFLRTGNSNFQFVLLKFCYLQARSQDLEKGEGGYFKRVRRVQTTLTRIFIPFEAVSHGLHENCDEISRKPRKFKGFFRPKSGVLQKKKKVFTDFETDFSAEISNSKLFFPQIQVVSKKKKKKVFTDFETDCSAHLGNPNV